MIADQLEILTWVPKLPRVISKFLMVIPIFPPVHHFFQRQASLTRSPAHCNELKPAEEDPQLSHRGSSSADLDRGIVSDDDDDDENEGATAGIIAGSALNAGETQFLHFHLVNVWKLTK